MNRNVLLRVFLQNNSLEALLEAVGLSLGLPVLVTDNAFHVVAAFAPEDFEDDGYRRALSHSELPLPLCRAVTEGLAASGASSVTVTEGTHTVRACELASGEAALGYLFCVLQGEAQLDGEEELFVRQLLAKQFFLERHAGGAPVDSAEEILVDLLDGRFENEERFRLRVGGSFLARFRPQRFALIDCFDAAAFRESGEHLRQTLRNRFSASHPFFYDGHLILFLHEDHDIRLLQGLTEEYRLQAVLSEPLPDLYALRRQYPLVRDVLEYVRAAENGPFLKQSDTYVLLMLLRFMEKLSDFPQREIGELYRYDRENGSELCRTLYEYLLCRHSLQRTCERLFTHRNTVQYRIVKIREEFGLDPDADGGLACLLSLAFALLRLGEEQCFLKAAPAEP